MHVSITSIFAKQFGYLNMWKAANLIQYPLEFYTKKATESGRVTRGISNKKFIKPKTLCSFIGDVTRLWNKAPENVRYAKKVIRIHCETLPI